MTQPGAGNHSYELIRDFLKLPNGERFGLVSRVVPDGDLPQAARELALSLADGPTVTLGYIKRNLDQAQHNSLAAQLDAECLHHIRCAATEDHQEAARAFVEKRAASFRGR